MVKNIKKIIRDYISLYIVQAQKPDSQIEARNKHFMDESIIEAFYTILSPNYLDPKQMHQKIFQTLKDAETHANKFKIGRITKHDVLAAWDLLGH